MATQGITSAAGNFGSPTQLLILLAIVLLLFGGKRLRNLGGDIGSAIKGFKNSVANTDTDAPGDNKSPHPLIHSQAATITPNHESEKNPVKRVGG